MADLFCDDAKKFMIDFPRLAQQVSDYLPSDFQNDLYVVVVQPSAERQKINLNDTVGKVQKVLVIAQEGASVSVEDFWSATALKHQRKITFYLEPKASVIVSCVYSTDKDASSLSYHVIGQEKSNFKAFMFFSGKSLDVDIATTLIGAEASAAVRGAKILAANDEMKCITTQQHIAPGSLSSVEFRAVLADNAALNHTGVIDIDNDARNANATQRTKAIALGENIKFYSKPCFKSRVHDVSCVHASAIGTFDSGQKWFLKSRGLSDTQVRHLLLRAFFDDLFNDAPCSVGVREIIVDALKKLDPMNMSN